MTPDAITAAPSPPLRGCAAVPGDKSISHRALILGALAEGETRIEGLLESLDTHATVAALQAFGARVVRESPGCWSVTGEPWRTPEAPVDCGNSGTTARLLMGAMAGFQIQARFTGDRSLCRRPMDRVVEPLRQMGATFAAGHEPRLPLDVRGGNLRGISHVNRHGSAQVKSAVLLAGLNAAGPVEVLESRPSRDHSERMLRQFGCEIDFAPGYARLGRHRRLKGQQVKVPGDPSSAAFLIAAALLVPGSRVGLGPVLHSALRGGFLQTLLEMGARLDIHRESDECIRLNASHCSLRAVEVPAERFTSMVDEYPILAVIAAFAVGRTRLSGLAELRVKESDRISAMAEGLRRCGVGVEVEGDNMVIEGCGGPPRGGAFVETQNDHRVAMSMLVLGLAAREPVTIDSGCAIATSFPGFVGTLRALGGTIE